MGKNIASEPNKSRIFFARRSCWPHTSCSCCFVSGEPDAFLQELRDIEGPINLIGSASIFAPNFYIST